jgi:hypothetical protein
MPRHPFCESSFGKIIQRRHDHAMADWLGSADNSPAGPAKALPGAGDGAVAAEARTPAEGGRHDSPGAA